MEHLFNSLVRIERLNTTVQDGQAVTSYVQATDSDPAIDALLHALPCRLDLNFIRNGKDAIPAQVAGRAPDRFGVLFASAFAPLKAADRVVTIPNSTGDLPVDGTFEIRAIPDRAIAFSARHHIEVQVVEVGQELTTDWPFEVPI